MSDEPQVRGADNLPEEVTSALGRIALKHAQLDGILQTVIGALVGYETDNFVQVRTRDIVQGQPTSELVRVTKKLVESVETPVAEELGIWAQRVRQSAEDRSASLHAVWFVLPGGHQVAMRLGRRGTTFQGVATDDLARMEALQDSLISEGLEFARQLGAD